MKAFDRYVMVDWSGGNDTGPRPRKDAIWMGEAGEAPQYLRNRLVAEQVLSNRIDMALSCGERLMIGFDFPFGYPAGFARALTGRDDPLAIWDWLEARIEDAPKGNNRVDVAGQINLNHGAGKGPFWFNPLRRDIAGVPRNKANYANPFVERRMCERHAKGSFTCWQLGGAGAVGSQVLLGLPVLNRLRRRFHGQIAVWPFDPLDAPVAFVEIWPGLINASVRALTGPEDIRDAVQVQTLAKVLEGLDPARLRSMLKVDAPEEGWILGLGFEKELAVSCH
ncbi:molybdopterin guanine dinucleotide synthesis [Primorskyibacter sp. 2E233]|uniref:molybdopterin guanine dinucleotide synthesis n=1 Tax=Primorskyibacter sp. 2E233 TaxID=3413431 RepID=UPI003BF22409